MQRSPRIFENPVLEYFSRNHWYVIPIVWGPISIWMFLLSVSAHGFTYALWVYVAGILSWTILEYVLHRWLFHIDVVKIARIPVVAPWKRWLFACHFILHGVHHRFPSDPERLVFPPFLTAVFVVIIHLIARMIVPVSLQWAIKPWMAGALAGYISYDVCHYTLHHTRKHTWGLLHSMRKHHMYHHFHDSTKNFGITSAVWDKLLFTLD